MTQPLTSLANAPKQAERAVYEFEVPERHQGPHQIKTFGIHELTPEEEVMASARAGNEAGAMAIELLKQALCEVNGERCTVGDGSTDIWLGKLGAPARGLALTAYAEINTPSKDEVAVFLKTRRAKF